MVYTEKMKRMLGEAKTSGKKHVTVEFRRIHYELIANVLKSSKDETWENVVFAFAQRFKKLSPRGFDPRRFGKACGL